MVDIYLLCKKVLVFFSFIIAANEASFSVFFFVSQSEQDGLWETSQSTGQEVCSHIDERADLDWTDLII